MNGDYSSLIEEIRPGDSVTVYYEFQDTTDINIDLVQVEQNGKTIVQASEYEKKESSLIYIGFFAIVLNVGYSIYYYVNRTRDTMSE